MIYYASCADDGFQQLQKDFLEKYYDRFEDVEENKLIYTDIHREYVNIVYRKVKCRNSCL